MIHGPLITMLIFFKITIMFKFYRKLISLISTSGFVAITVWQFTNFWKELLFAVIITNESTKPPITVILVNLAGSQVVEME